MVAQAGDEQQRGARPSPADEPALHDVDAQAAQWLSSEAVSNATISAAAPPAARPSASRQLALALALAISQIAAIAWAMALLF